MFNLVHLNFIGRLNQLVIETAGKNQKFRKLILHDYLSILNIN
ncbi:hypothetical protein MYAER_4159 [Microcystis aeruginosa NIES-2549]|uniref:Uncharacterized protein n=1 Tax=Microcystis aeruginosa NIES-2549 TaxID=1641812 RepID=A0A0F6RNV2_MICAE|nr:hypothetical protein MYAER_4159 [Microcystis aeruginosa NIES-2549]